MLGRVRRCWRVPVVVEVGKEMVMEKVMDKQE